LSEFLLGKVRLVTLDMILSINFLSENHSEIRLLLSTRGGQPLLY